LQRNSIVDADAVPCYYHQKLIDLEAQHTKALA
jgi:predicted  nucleic acid-binding Zn-ribbon protein